MNSTCRLKASASSPLHLAAVSGDVDVTKYLLRKGAKIAATDKRKDTPLHKAAEYYCMDVVQYLLGHV